MSPNRVVLVSLRRETAENVGQPCLLLHFAIVPTDFHTAEMIEHSSNAFLTTCILFANEMTSICKALGADT